MMSRDVEVLKMRLVQLERQEEYENAARVRDWIKELEDKIVSGNKNPHRYIDKELKITIH